MKTKSRPFLVAIVGGSASGKTWLAGQLQSAIGGNATRLSLDDFYRDRSHLSPKRRARINYDHPRAIDWPILETALRDWLAGRKAKIPSYNFATHSRHPQMQTMPPAPVILADGLWLLHRAPLRKMFALSIFIDCPAQTRLNRRLTRDVKLRGRTGESVRRQFAETVEPMHNEHVAPQARWAHVRLQTPIKKSDLRQLAKKLAENCEPLNYQNPI